MINIRSQLRFWIEHRVKYGKYSNYPVTEGYLRFMFDDSSEKYEKYLSEIQMKQLFVSVKQHFKIDKEAPDNWTPPDAGFEIRVLHTFAEKLCESSDLLYNAPEMEMMFHNIRYDI